MACGTICICLFMHNKQSDGSLEENAFLKFLELNDRIYLAYALTNPGVKMLFAHLYIAKWLI